MTRGRLFCAESSTQFDDDRAWSQPAGPAAAGDEPAHNMKPRPIKAKRMVNCAIITLAAYRDGQPLRIWPRAVNRLVAAQTSLTRLP